MAVRSTAETRAANDTADHDAAALRIIRDSGLVLGDWYREVYPELAGEADPAAHYARQGWQEGRRPNPYFDTAWYLEQNADVRGSGGNPLRHYIAHGDAEGRHPSLCFDPAWYRQVQGLGAEVPALAHYLARRRSGTVSPIPEFDVAFYLETYPDVAVAKVDPFEHFLAHGFKESRNPAPGFDTRFYRRRYLRDAPDVNPLLHYLAHRGQPGIHPRKPETEGTIPAQVRRFTRPGPDFEEFHPLPATAERRARVLAYYLPQFHPVPQNDAWWGRGFTEWTNLPRALPRFVGHYQPRVPRDLGHYTLAGTETLRRQIGMALGAGLSGFVFYFYWFNGARLLDAPTEAFLADATLDFPFCLMWTNENWTRRWDGADDDVLIAQHYRETDDGALIADFARHFADPRYIRLDGRPLLMIYRPGLIPDAPATIARWRERFRAQCGEDPVLVMAQGFGDTDPRPFGLDGAVEFPPHKVCAGLPPRNQGLEWLDPDASCLVFDYADVAASALAEPAPDFPLIKAAFPGWDNDARREGHGMVVHGATPAAYQAWLATLVERARAAPFMGEALVCINAWNEWAEGAYLEPDLHFGAAFLNATARAISGRMPIADRGKLLLIGHDAHRHGAQTLLLALARQMRRAHGIAVEIVLLDAGPMAAEYAAAAPFCVAPTEEALAAQLAAARDRGFRAALVNTSAAGRAVPMLARLGIAPVLLVHELPRLIAEKSLLPQARAGALAARHIVFPAPFVAERFLALTGADPARAAILPQGAYRQIDTLPADRAAIRAELGVKGDAVLALGIGFADLRKGFDLFLQLWRTLHRRGANAHLAWAGGMEQALVTYLADEMKAAGATGTFHHLGFRDDIPALLAAADVFVLPSREDPLPSVALEAISAGLPVIAFAGTGGIPDLIARHEAGAAVPLGDLDAMADAILRHAPPKPAERARLAALARAEFRFDAYAARLASLATPGLLDISVAVPNYNYAAHLPARLGSIFGQTHPVREVIVLDDASTDDSLAVAAATAGEWGRAIRIVANETNAGSVFRQWQRAAETAEGAYLWIAEADDSSDPRFLETLVEALARAPDALLAFTDSQPIGADGAPLGPDYKSYYSEVEPGALAIDGTWPADAFARRFLAERNLILNVSAVLWRRAALLEALERCRTDLADLRLAGDWRLYLELLAGAPGTVVYAAAPLNRHRRHAASVTHALDPARHLQEIALVQGVAAERLSLPSAQRDRQQRYLRALAIQLGAVR
ncbi:MAG TPA: glycoside hydrolase family 99-like domain-containing protein, partial [Acetobacteraceae bacterium]|nr:glycoside hydrolase family 99-like domain-containing protein [Acetobacteraceae bacterium]